MRVAGILRYDFRVIPRRAHEPSAASRFYLDVVDEGAHWKLAERQAIRGLDRRRLGNDERVAHCYLLRKHRVPSLSVRIYRKTYERRTIRVIFYRGYLRRNIFLVVAEVHHAIGALVAAAFHPQFPSACIPLHLSRYRYDAYHSRCHFVEFPHRLHYLPLARSFGYVESICA